jgi:hypothetical protein
MVDGRQDQVVGNHTPADNRDINAFIHTYPHQLSVDLYLKTSYVIKYILSIEQLSIGRALQDKC